MSTPRFALLFDFDGTIVDTDTLHFHAYRTLLRRFGRELDETGYGAELHGKPNDLVLSELFPNLGRAERAMLAEEKEHNFRSSIGAIDGWG